MATKKAVARRVLAVGETVADVDPKLDAMAAAQRCVEQLDELLLGLNKMMKASDSLQTDMKINARIAEAASEKQDQLKLLRDLQATTAEISPMTEETREALQSAITQLDNFVREDQALQARLAFADAVIGAVNDHEQDIRGLLT